MIGAGFDVSVPIIFDGDIKISAQNINAYLLPQENYWVLRLLTHLSRERHGEGEITMAYRST